MVPKDQKTVDRAWENVVPAHGITAVDYQWRTEKNLLDTMSLPSDPLKRVYIFDAYHQVHCLVYVYQGIF